jgi:hypothetical protein
MTRPLDLKERFIPPTSVGRFAYTAPDGTYLASIAFDAASPEVLVAAAEKFLAFAIAKSGGIQRPNLAEVSAVRRG